MTRWILATCVFLSVLGCSADEASSKMSSQFVGRWTAQYSIKDQGAFRYVIDRKPDGGYELQTVRVDGDKVLERESESGKWFVLTEGIGRQAELRPRLGSFFHRDGLDVDHGGGSLGGQAGERRQRPARRSCHRGGAIVDGLGLHALDLRRSTQGEPAHGDLPRDDARRAAGS